MGPKESNQTNKYEAKINVSSSRTQHSDNGEARTRSPLVSDQALYKRTSDNSIISLKDFILYPPEREATSPSPHKFTTHEAK